MIEISDKDWLTLKKILEIARDQKAEFDFQGHVGPVIFDANEIELVDRLLKK